MHLLTDLSDRLVLVTGGARGIGAEIAVQAARAGARVAIGYRTSQAEAQQTVGRISELGGLAHAFSADLADPGEVQRVVSEIEDRMGHVDGLVNCAAVMAWSDFLETDVAEWDRMLRNDLYSVIFTCQAVLPGMLERGNGAIVNIASRLAVAGSADAAPYAVAKAAVIALTRSLALAYASRGVRISAVAPGTANTDMGRGVIQSAVGAERLARIPIRRFVETSEVAATVVFLLSDAAAGLSGQTLHVNGGELMV